MYHEAVPIYFGTAFFVYIFLFIVVMLHLKRQAYLPVKQGLSIIPEKGLVNIISIK